MFRRFTFLSVIVVFALAGCDSGNNGDGNGDGNGNGGGTQSSLSATIDGESWSADVFNAARIGSAFSLTATDSETGEVFGLASASASSGTMTIGGSGTTAWWQEGSRLEDSFSAYGDAGASGSGQFMIQEFSSTRIRGTFQVEMTNSDGDTRSFTGGQMNILF